MKADLRWAFEAQKDLEKLDQSIADRIIKKVVWFSEQTEPYSGIFRFRVGEYRILFEKDDKGKLCILVILRVKHRKEVYR